PPGIRRPPGPSPDGLWVGVASERLSIGGSKPAGPGPLVVRARSRADHRFLRASGFEEDRGRDRENAEAGGSLDVLVDVQLREGDPALVLPLELGKDR